MQDEGRPPHRLARWRRRLRLQGWRLWAVLAVLGYTLLGFVLLPWLVRQQAPGLARDALGIDLAIEKVRLNPYLLSTSIEGLAATDAETGHVLAFDRLFVDFQLASLWKRAWTFREITLDAFHADVTRFADGRSNLQIILDRLPDDPEADVQADAPDDAAPVRVIIQALALNAGRLDLLDETRPTPWSLSLGPVSLAMQDFATLAGQEGSYQLDATSERGGQLSWTGDVSVFPLRSAGRLELRNIDVTTPWSYVRDEFDADIDEGAFDIGFEYALDASPGDLALRLSRGRVELTDARLARRSSGDELVRLPRVAATGIDFDLQSMALAIDAVELAEPAVNVRRLEDGRLDLAAAFAPAGAAAVDETAGDAEVDAAADAAPSFTMKLATLNLHDGRASFEDRAAPRPVSIEIEGIVLDVSDYRSAEGHRAEVDLAATLASGGSLAAAGPVRGVPLDIVLDVTATDVSLLPLLPYADGKVGLEIDALAAGAQGRISVSGDEPFAFTGEATLLGLESRLPGQEPRLIAWRQLAAEGIDLSLAGNALRIGMVSLAEPFVRIHIDEQGQMNLAAIAPAGDAAEAADDADADAGAPPDTAAEPLAIGVGRVEIGAGGMDFTDLNLPLPFHAIVDAMTGSVSAITSGSATPARVEIDGDVNEYGAATIRGSLDPFDPTRVMDLELDFRNVEMPDLTPYMVKFAGREIADGRLDVDLSWSIRDGQLEANNRMVIRDLKLGDKVESPGAMSLPLDLAVALLTDTQGRIDLEVPVYGDLNDPQFRYAPLVFKALGNVLGKIVTAPFRFLASLLGGGAEEADLEFVGFVAGDAALRGPEAEELAKLAEALAQRPELALQVGAAFDEARDGRALRERRLDAAISGRFEAGEGAGKDGDPVRLIMESLYAEAEGPEAPVTLQAAHSATPEGGDKPVLDETRYLEALRAALLALQVIEPQEFRLLGMERAASVRNTLVDSGGLDPARIALAEPAEAPRADENLVFLKLDLDVGR